MSASTCAATREGAMVTPCTAVSPRTGYIVAPTTSRVVVTVTSPSW